MRVKWVCGGGLSLAGALCLSAVLLASSSNPVADAAMQGNRNVVRTLLKQGEDVNAAQGDGMTALHWAAMHGDAELVRMLLYAGASVRATTRLGAYTPLHLAARANQRETVAALLTEGASVDAITTSGATPLMFAAAAGDPRIVTMLVENGADVHAGDTKGVTPLMFAAAANQVASLMVLVRSGADATRATKVVDLVALTTPEDENARAQSGQAAGTQPRPMEPRGATRTAGARADQTPARVATPGVDRPFRYNELIGTQGGLTALLFAARHGYVESATALIELGADVNQANPGDQTSPLLMAIINGHFDLAISLLAQGADPNAAADNGVTPLYAVLNMQWHNKSPHPQPKAYQQQRTTYLELMQALLDGGAHPNVRLKRKVWYSAYNSDFAGVDEIGATPFWRAAYASDVDAMRLLVQHGADPTIPTARPAGRPRAGDQVRDALDVSGQPPVPVGGPGVYPLHAAAGVGYGEGFAANAHRYAPIGFLPAIRYLVEEVGADVNAIDHEGNTPVHLAASRGDTDSVLYLVSKGADVTRVNREGNSAADMANGPVQRTQPYPETLSVLIKLGARNNNKCVTC